MKISYVVYIYFTLSSFRYIKSMDSVEFPIYEYTYVRTLQKKSMLWVSTIELQHLKFNFFWKISDIYETKKYILVWFTFKSKRGKASSCSSFYNKPIDDDVVKADGKIGNSVAFRFNLSHVQFRKKWWQKLAYISYINVCVQCIEVVPIFWAKNWKRCFLKK